MNEKITPLPWKLPIYIDSDGVLFDNLNGAIGEFLSSEPETDTFGGHIVEAVNAYPALTARVKELEEALERYMAGHPCADMSEQTCCPTVIEARAALNKEPT